MPGIDYTTLLQQEGSRHQRRTPPQVGYGWQVPKVRVPGPEFDAVSGPVYDPNDPNFGGLVPQQQPRGQSMATGERNTNFFSPPWSPVGHVYDKIQDPPPAPYMEARPKRRGVLARLGHTAMNLPWGQIGQEAMSSVGEVMHPGEGWEHARQWWNTNVEPSREESMAPWLRAVGLAGEGQTGVESMTEGGMQKGIPQQAFQPHQGGEPLAQPTATATATATQPSPQGFGYAGSRQVDQSKVGLRPNLSDPSKLEFDYAHAPSLPGTEKREQFSYTPFTYEDSLHKQAEIQRLKEDAEGPSSRNPYLDWGTVSKLFNNPEMQKGWEHDVRGVDAMNAQTWEHQQEQRAHQRQQWGDESTTAKINQMLGLTSLVGGQQQVGNFQQAQAMKMLEILAETGLGSTPEGKAALMHYMKQLQIPGVGAATNTTTGNTPTPPPQPEKGRGALAAFGENLPVGASGVAAWKLIPKLIGEAGMSTGWGRAAKLIGALAAPAATAWGMSKVDPKYADTSTEHPIATAAGTMVGGYGVGKTIGQPNVAEPPAPAKSKYWDYPEGAFGGGGGRGTPPTSPTGPAPTTPPPLPRPPWVNPPVPQQPIPQVPPPTVAPIEPVPTTVPQPPMQPSGMPSMGNVPVSPMGMQGAQMSPKPKAKVTKPKTNEKK